MIKETLRRKKQIKTEWIGKYFSTDRISLFVQFWFKFANKKHFKDQTVQFTLTFLQNLEISFEC